jgi:hypothetical protein
LENPNPKEVDHTGKRAVGIVLAVVASVLVLTWAVATFFEIAVVKALAGVILVLFVVAIGLLVAGVG